MPISIDTYVVLKFAGIIWFAVACFWHLRRYPISMAARTFFVLAIVFSGFFGSKLWYMIQHFTGSEPYPYDDLAEAWNQAGSVLYGWILGGSLATWFGASLLAIPPRRLFDGFLPQMLVAQILNRIGCWMAGCCWGKGPCDLPWAVVNELAPGIRIHPVQLYEAAFDLLLLVVLLTIGKGKRPGWVTRVYFVGYALGRFFLEFFRGDNQAAVAGLTVPQITSGLIIVFVVLVIRKKPT